MTFSERVVELALSIPPGRVVTYGDLARAAGGGAMAARSVSSILGKFPNQKAIPWHRIVYADGKIWCTKENSAKRRSLYEQEGIEVDASGRIIDFDEVVFDLTEL